MTVTLRARVPFRGELLKHPGIEPGGKIRLDLLPDGRGERGYRGGGCGGRDVWAEAPVKISRDTNVLLA